MPKKIEWIRPETDEVFSQFEYRGWFKSFGLMFPREIVMSTFGNPDGTPLTIGVAVVTLRISSLYSVNEPVNPNWFVPQIRFGADFTEDVPTWGIDGAEAEILVWPDSARFYKYGEYLPELAP
jgi:hypothetical protein